MGFLDSCRIKAGGFYRYSVEIYYLIRYLAITGVWSIRDFTPTGVVLYGIWFVEAAIIIGGSVLIATSIIKTKPFCEKCNEWVEKNELLVPLNFVDNIEELKLKLEQGDFEALTHLGKAETDSCQYTTVTLKHCEQCKEFYLISVWATTITKNQKGEEKTNNKEIVNRLIVDQHVYDYLMEWNRSLIAAQ